jgi:hypothetical protein
MTTRIPVIGCCVFFCLTLLAQLGPGVARVGTGKTQPSLSRKPIYHQHPKTPLLYEDFENPTGYDLAGWGEDVGPGGVVNEDYTATVLYGTQSLLVDELEDDPVMTTNSFAPQDRVWVAVIFRAVSIPDTADSTFLRLNDASGNCQIRLTLNNDGNEMRAQFACAGLAYLVGNISVNTTYYIWMEYWNDNGANSYVTVSFSTSPVKPTSGPGFMEATGTATATQVSHVQLGHSSGENGQEVDFIIDHLLIDDEPILDYP